MNTEKNKTNTMSKKERRKQYYESKKAMKAKQKAARLEKTIKSITLPGEIWVDITDYPAYKISNLGRVFSSKTCKLQEQTPNSRGYLRVHLQMDRMDKFEFTHRLVARHFVPNPDFKNIVNHIDGNKINNVASNLEWCTAQENILHARNVLHVNSNPIACYDSETRARVKIFYYLVDAVTEFKTSYKTLNKALREGTLAKGFYWGYCNEYA